MSTIKLNMNEMPFPPSDKVIKEAKKGLAKLNRYSDPKDLDALQGAIAKYCNVSKRHIVLSNGSDSLLREIIHSFSNHRKVIMVYPSFFPIAKCAKESAKKLLRIQLSPPSFRLNPKIIYNEIQDHTLIIIDNPNNPTGKALINRDLTKNILENKNTLLVVDEAYFEFSGITMADLVEQYPNLAITRTLDKAFGLAGARIGYLIAGDIFLDKLSSSYSFLPQASLNCALKVIENPGESKQKIKYIIKEKNRIQEALDKIGLQVFSSKTNFLLIKSNIVELTKKLEDRNILVFDLSKHWIPGYIRVTIGTQEENDIFLSNIKYILQKHKES